MGSALHAKLPGILHQVQNCSILMLFIYLYCFLVGMMDLDKTCRSRDKEKSFKTQSRFCNFWLSYLPLFTLNSDSIQPARVVRSNLALGKTSNLGSFSLLSPNLLFSFFFLREKVKKEKAASLLYAHLSFSQANQDPLQKQGILTSLEDQALK